MKGYEELVGADAHDDKLYRFSVIYKFTDENENIGFGNILWNFVHNEPDYDDLDSCKRQIKSWHEYKSITILNVMPLPDGTRGVIFYGK